MIEPRQLNVRVPDEARDLMTTIAARLRHDEGFSDKLAAWLETLNDPTADDSLAERVARIEARLDAMGVAGDDAQLSAPTTPTPQAPPTTRTDTPTDTPQRDAPSDDGRLDWAAHPDDPPDPPEAEEGEQPSSDDTPTDTPPRGAAENIRQFLPGGESLADIPQPEAGDRPEFTTGEGTGRRLTPEGIREIERRIEAGEDDKAIAGEVGVGVGTVKAWRKDIEGRLI